MLPLAAYADRLSVRPGETIRFHAHNATDAPVEGRLVRVLCADANPAGPGVQLEDIESKPAKQSEPGPQQVPHGSYGVVSGAGALFANSFTVTCRVWPTHANQQIQSLISMVGQAGFALSIDPELRLSLKIAEQAQAAVMTPLSLRRWYMVFFRFDASDAVAEIGYLPLNNSPDALHGHGTQVDAAMNIEADDALIFAATQSAGTVTQHFTGKLERPTVFGRCLSDAELTSLAQPEAVTEVRGAGACWDFAEAPQSSVIHDIGPDALDGLLVNAPTRAVTSSTWRGQAMHFVQAPAHFGAIHFHADDIDDCQWPVAFEWTVPEGTKSDVYALMLRAGDSEENVPFHVVPPRGTQSARIAVLASTYTYTIYGNHARLEYQVDKEWRKRWHTQVEQWGCYPHNPGDHVEYGLSTYNTHVDGSGISIASWHRPMLNVRIGYLTYCDEAIRGSGLRHFPADSHLTYWLQQQGLEYDIVTDVELDAEGYELLENYRVVLTGSHPEYHTSSMMDALEQYRDQGGRFCYLGGNGFYWKIAKSPERDGVIEIRRGEGGIRAWAAEPGEYYNQFDGEYGGLWRRNGRPPQNLTGVGFTAQGNFHGSYYRRTAASEDARVAWMFKNIDSDVLGNHGLSAHGAAGFELDRTDKRLGTPDHAIVVAASEDHPADAPWVLVPEELLTHISTWPGDDIESLIRADMTFFETDNGGAVFSVGSITFCGSLLTNSCDNEISTLVRNVVDRFLDEAEFVIPTPAADAEDGLDGH